MVLERILHFLGSSLCHQNPARSFACSGLAMPVCARCTGIYIAILISSLTISLVDRKSRNILPSGKILWGMLPFLLLMGLDVGLSTLGIYETGNMVSFLTGFMVGWCIPLILLPVRNLLLFKPGSQGSYLQKKCQFLAWMGTAPVFMTLFYFFQTSWCWLWSVLSVAGLILLVALLLMLLWFSLNSKASGKISRGWAQVKIYVIFTAASLSLLSVLSVLRIFLLPY
ncbi:MAG: DUF2085 domain-containing protein [Actinomycetota bacterium]|nr:DUF2085 domain-containing protein [Actinomycetota bacterium]